MTKPTDKPTEEAKHLEIVEAVKAQRFGEVLVIVNDGRVVEVKTTQKTRYQL